MNSNHRVVLYNSGGTQLSRLREWGLLKYTSRLNRPGDIEIRAHKDAAGASDLVSDNRCEVFRNDTSVWSGKFDWENPKYDASGDPSAYRTVRGADYNRLPNRQVLRDAGSAFTGNPDDVMKHFARYAWGGSASATRQLSNFSVSANTSSCPGTYTMTARPRDNVADVIRRVGDAASVDWWISYAGGSYTFHTGYPRRGTDKSSSIVFTVNRGNVKDYEYEKDTVDRANYVYVGGPGDGAVQTIGSVHKGAEPSGWDRYEVYVSAENAEYASELSVYGSAYLDTFGSGLENVRFGVYEISDHEWPTDWDIGDLVTVYDPKFGHTTTAKVEEIAVTVNSEGVDDLRLTVGKPRPTEWEKLMAHLGPYQTIGTYEYGGATDDTAPASPTGLGTATAVVEDDQGNQSAVLNLDWDDNAELDLEGYQAELKRGGETVWQTQRVTASEATFDGLELGGSYYARVKACDTSGNESAYVWFNDT